MSADKTHTIILIDSETEKPLEDGTIVLDHEKYSLIEKLAEEQNLSFEKAFIQAVIQGLELLPDTTRQLRFTVSETEGRKRSFSYLIDDWAPVGVYDDDTLPEELVGELEGFSQGPDVPSFLYNPSGKVQYTVTVENSE